MACSNSLTSRPLGPGTAQARDAAWALRRVVKRPYPQTVNLPESYDFPLSGFP